MRAGRGYSLALCDPPERPSTPAILPKGHVVLDPLSGGVRIGGAMEITGVRDGVSRSRARRVMSSGERPMPESGETAFAGVQPWCGFRPTIPDGLPHVDRAAEWVVWL